MKLLLPFLIQCVNISSNKKTAKRFSLKSQRKAYITSLILLLLAFALTAKLIIPCWVAFLTGNKEMLPLYNNDFFFIVTFIIYILTLLFSLIGIVCIVYLLLKIVDTMRKIRNKKTAN